MKIVGLKKIYWLDFYQLESFLKVIFYKLESFTSWADTSPKPQTLEPDGRWNSRKLNSNSAVGFICDNI